MLTPIKIISDGDTKNFGGLNLFQYLLGKLLGDRSDAACDQASDYLSLVLIKTIVSRYLEIQGTL